MAGFPLAKDHAQSVGELVDWSVNVSAPPSVTVVFDNVKSAIAAVTVEFTVM